MKRSIGVRIWAVLLIVSGGWTISMNIWWKSENTAYALARAVAGVIEIPNRSDSHERALSPEQREAQLQQRLQQMPSKIQAVLELPKWQLFGWCKNLLSLAALIAGIGLLMFKGWARLLVVWRAVMHIAFSLIMPHRILGILPSLTAAGVITPEEAFKLIPTNAEFLRFLVPSLAWNGLIIWFFNRPSVKAQFEPART